MFAMFIRIFFKIIKRIILAIADIISWIITWIKLKLNGVEFNDFKSGGYPQIAVSLKGKFSIGKNFIINNGRYYNIIGRQQPCYIIVGPNANLKIGNNVGISCTAIICKNSITIGDNVKIGGNTVIYDTDFHSLDVKSRTMIPEDTSNAITQPVIIEANVFIGAHTTILKGVTIGENSIVGACSVVTKNIPSNELWAGNPAKFIRKNNG